MDLLNKIRQIDKNLNYHDVLNDKTIKEMTITEMSNIAFKFSDDYDQLGKIMRAYVDKETNFDLVQMQIKTEIILELEIMIEKLNSMYDKIDKELTLRESMLN